MAYILFGALLFAVGWGLKSAMSVPHPDGLTVILSSTVVLVGSLFWVVVTLHALDLPGAQLVGERIEQRGLTLARLAGPHHAADRQRGDGAHDGAAHR